MTAGEIGRVLDITAYLGPARSLPIGSTSSADGEGTRVSLRHDHLDDSADHEALRRRWADALERFGAATA